jgi:hypothetical protein
MKVLILLLFLGVPLTAQIHAGLKAGVPFTEITRTTHSGAILVNLPSRWTVGPMVELDLPFGFGVEVNALYRRVGYESDGMFSEPNREFRDSLWDFP